MIITWHVFNQESWKKPPIKSTPKVAIELTDVTDAVEVIVSVGAEARGIGSSVGAETGKTGTSVGAVTGKTEASVRLETGGTGASVGMETGEIVGASVPLDDG